MPILMVTTNIFMLSKSILRKWTEGVEPGAWEEWRGGPILVALLQIATQRRCYKFTRSMLGKTIWRDLRGEKEKLLSAAVSIIWWWGRVQIFWISILSHQVYTTNPESCVKSLKSKEINFFWMAILQEYVKSNSRIFRVFLACWACYCYWPNG